MVTKQLPLLDQVVGVTVAGPVIMNDVGTHFPPVGPGGPIRTDPTRISLRINAARLGSALVTEPTAHVPPTLRLFDSDGNTAHATYLTEGSDRLAFEALSLTGAQSRSPGGDTAVEGVESVVAPADPAYPAATRPHDAAVGHLDQVDQFDEILADGGRARHGILPRFCDDGHRRVESRRVIAALEHAALLNTPVTLASAAAGCLQMHHNRLDGAREHRGQMVLASGSCRVMINFNLVSECWITWSQGVWGRTGSIEVYDRSRRCSLVITQTGTVPAMAYDAWTSLLADIAS